MSEQDKEMESAAESWWNGQNIAPPWTRDGIKSVFYAGWKAASERKDAEISTLENFWEQATAANRLYTSEIQSLQSKLATALECLEWYAAYGSEESIPLKKQSEYSLCQMYTHARAALAKIKGDSK